MRNKIFTIIFILLSFNEYAKNTNNNATLKDPQIYLKKYFLQQFDQPVDMAVFPELLDGEKYFAVAEKKGIIYLISPAGSKNKNNKIVLLDFRSHTCSDGYEEGLLGIAFDPEYKKTHQMYIYYSKCKPSSTNLSRVLISYKINKKNVIFTATENNILSIAQPYSNHNGGHLEFGKDGYLYLGTGDGGSAGDPHNNAQNLNSLLGKILRLDVHTHENYLIPPDNPVQKKGRPEIFAWGLRNPWRFSIDHETGLLWAGDVGQDSYEEISIIKKGENHGWKIMEGRHCFFPLRNCNRSNLVLPIYEYSHDEGRSIIGGYVYRGKDIPDLQGKYIFGDYTTGKIWYINAVDKPQYKAMTLLNTTLYISSFAKDDSGEIYVLDIDGGYIYKMVLK
ncbi:MAG: PQQ-dependent sugar dehydrogenase [Spirochaetia bacterium]|nr:PQQ-dependent sugar dehydrogenase [Spirochaetia bacterium]